MKHPHLIKQENRDTAAGAFFDFGAELNEEGFNIAPLNIRAGRTSKNQLDNSLMPPLHSPIVPVLGTEDAYFALDDGIRPIIPPAAFSGHA